LAPFLLRRLAPGIPIWRPIAAIIFLASKNRSTSWLTSETWTPEPLAMRSRREALMIFGLARSAGVIPRMIACSRSSCFSSARAGQHAEQVADRAHLADRQHLVEEVLQGEFPAADLARGLLGLLLVVDLFGLLDQGEHITHTEDAAGHPVGMEDVEVLQFLAG